MAEEQERPEKRAFSWICFYFDRAFEWVRKLLAAAVEPLRAKVSFELAIAEAEPNDVDDIRTRIHDLEKGPETAEQYKGALRKLRAVLREVNAANAAKLKLLMDELHKVRSAFQTSYARECEWGINEFSGLEFGSIDANREAVKQIQEVLALAGLKVKDPVSGQPANLVHKRSGNAKGRFVCEYYDEYGKKRSGYSFNVLPYLELVPDKENSPHVSRFTEIYGPAAAYQDALGKEMDFAA